MGIQRKMRRAAKATNRGRKPWEPYPGARDMLDDFMTAPMSVIGQKVAAFAGEGIKARRNPDIPSEWLVEENGELVARVYLLVGPECEDGGVLHTAMDLVVEFPPGQPVDTEEVPF